MGEIEPLRRAPLSSMRRKAPLSGREVLDTLVAIAEVSRQRFSTDLLYDPYFMRNPVGYPEGSYSRFIAHTLEELGIPVGLRRGYEPPFGLTRRHHDTSKEGGYHAEELEQFCEHLTMLDDISPYKDDPAALFGTEYHIMFPWIGMDGYFRKDDLKGELRENGVPPPMLGFLSGVYEMRERMVGRKDMEEVASEISDLCERLTPDDVSVLDFEDVGGDVFSYEGYVLHFRRNAPEQRDEELIRMSHDFSTPVLYWAFALYDGKQQKPIGYTFIDADTLGGTYGALEGAQRSLPAVLHKS